jgi:hypothetical protein
MAGQDLRRFLLCTAQIAALGLGLAGCVAGTSPDTAALTADGQPIVDATISGTTSVKLTDRDVEAPDIFQASGPALWDGRPSLGGVWVATPDAKDPERVILRNPANGKFVIGALFRREAANPGPKLLISSDAADVLGIVAGDPTKITVTALRREEAPVPQPDAKAPLLATSETVGAEQIAASAAKAIDGAATAAAAAAATTPAAKATAPTTTPPATTAPAKGTAPAAATTAAPAAATTTKAPATPPVTTAPLTAVQAPAAAPAKAAASGSVIQVGIFSVEANAQRAVDALTKAGVKATIHKGEAQGKTYWSVSAPGDAATLAKIKAAGFTDAYLVKK